MVARGNIASCPIPEPSVTQHTATDDSHDKPKKGRSNKKRAANPSAEDGDRDELSPTKKSKKNSTGSPEEKRLRRFRSSAPKAFYNVYERALSQRFFVLHRERGGTEKCPEETVELAGSTDNIYTISIAKVPSCNCPHAVNGNQCKHVIYVSRTL